MGSFNTTCFASFQTVAPRDKVRLMLIARQRTYRPVVVRFEDGLPQSLHGIANHTCYPDAFWAPVSWFLRAKYDDYGQFELLLETPQDRRNVFAALRTLLERAGVTEAGENEFHDIAVDLRSFLQAGEQELLAALDDPDALAFEDANALQEAWDYLAEGMREKRLFAADYQGVLSPVDIAVLHEDAYQYLLSRDTGCEDRPPRSSAEYVTSVVDAVEPLLGKARDPEHLAKVRAALEAHVAANGETSLGSVEEGMVNMQGAALMMFSMRLAERLAPDFAGDCAFMRQSLAEALEEPANRYFYGKSTKEQFSKEIQPYMADQAVYNELQHMNLRLSPQVYAGQDYSNDIGQAYANFVQTVSHQVTAGRG